MEKSKIIAAIEKLDRAGEGYRVTLKKLRESTDALCGHLCELVANENHKYPHGYRVQNVRSNIGSATYFFSPDGRALESHSYYLHGDFNARLGDEASAAELREFARDIAGGLLTEIAEHLEKLADEHTTGAENMTVKN